MGAGSCLDLQDFENVDKAKGFQSGYNDAHRDFKGLNGHGFDDSIHHGNADFKSGYGDGYHLGWDNAKRSINEKACHPL